MNIIRVGIEAIINLLTADSELMLLLSNDPGRIYAGPATGDEDFPYIVINHVMGGEDNRSNNNGFDMRFQVCAHAENQIIAADIADRIAAVLKYAVPAYLDGWSTVQHITEEMPIQDYQLAQNRTFYERGGEYRLRGNKYI